MQNHIFMPVIYPLLIWVTKQMHESWTEPAAWLCVFFSTPQKWDGYLGTDREIIWEDSTQYNDIAFYKKKKKQPTNNISSFRKLEKQIKSQHTSSIFF